MEFCYNYLFLFFNIYVLLMKKKTNYKMFFLFDLKNIQRTRFIVSVCLHLESQNLSSNQGATYGQYFKEIRCHWHDN